MAQQIGVSPQQEFHLLAVLGEDLPGALRAIPSEKTINVLPWDGKKDPVSLGKDTIFHFSLMA